MTSGNQLSLAFGKVLRKRRIQKKISQQQLGISSGLDRTFISMLERGSRQPSLKSIFSICEVLEIPPAEFLRQTERMLKMTFSARRASAPSKRL